MEADQRAVRDVHVRWIAAVNAGDLAQLLTLMADDVVFLNPGGEPLGRDGFPAVFSGAHERLLLRCVSEPQEITVVGDLAYTLCRDALSLKPRAGGEGTELAGYRLTIYRRHADGRWLLARDAHTLAPVAS